MSCPSCRWQADADPDKIRLREDLRTVWWSVGPVQPGAVINSRHCYRCQPHEVYVVACLVCGDGPILAGELAALALNSDTGPPQPILDELTRHGWRAASNAAGWVCCQ